MKKKFKIAFKNVRFRKSWSLFVMLGLFQTVVVFGQMSTIKKKVVFDLGHGGIDSGAKGLYGLKEKDALYQLGLELLKLNTLVFDDALNLYLTRYEDRKVSLADRGRLAKALEADYFISLHCNSGTTEAVGLEVFVHPHASKTSGEACALAKSVLKESSTNLGLKNRGVKTANFQVLRDTHNLCPAILIELGFVTNPDEATYLLKPKNLRALALSILLGLYYHHSSNP